MRRCNDNYLADDLPCPPGAGGPPRRSGIRFSPQPTQADSWGFVFPVLVVCAALWFLLSGYHPV
jgi:hypothetical protein